MSEDPAEDGKDPYRPLDGPGDPAADAWVSNAGRPCVCGCPRPGIDDMCCCPEPCPCSPCDYCDIGAERST